MLTHNMTDKNIDIKRKMHITAQAFIDSLKNGEVLPIGIVWKWWQWELFLKVREWE